MTVRPALCLLLAAAATAATAQTATSSPDAAAAPKPERKICRTVDTTGSIMMNTKVCHTKAEWAAIEQRNGDNIRSSRDIRGGGGSPRGI